MVKLLNNQPLPRDRNKAQSFQESSLTQNQTPCLRNPDSEAEEMGSGSRSQKDINSFVAFARDPSESVSLRPAMKPGGGGGGGGWVKTKLRIRRERFFSV